MGAAAGGARPTAGALPTWALWLVGGQAVFMAFWILVLPGSMWLGILPGHSGRMAAAISSPFADLSLVAKYEGHPLVQATHQLPAGVWSLLVPLQLSSRARRAAPRLHRTCGRVFFFCSAVMMLGVVAIEVRGLGFRHHVEDDDRSLPWSIFALGVWFAWSGGRVRPSPSPGPWVHSVQRRPSSPLTGASTVSQALAAIRAGRVGEHRAWVVRHVGAGLWVGVQRALMVFLVPVLHALGVADFTLAENKNTSFKSAAAAGVLVAVGGAECLVRHGQLRRVPEARRS